MPSFFVPTLKKTTESKHTKSEQFIYVVCVKYLIRPSQTVDFKSFKENVAIETHCIQNLISSGMGEWATAQNQKRSGIYFGKWSSQF